MIKNIFSISFTSSNTKGGKIIYEGLVAYNKPHFGHKKLVEFGCFLRDDAGNIKGGATGEFSDHLGFIWLLWLDEDYRGGAGRKIMEVIEQEARARNVKQIHLDTYSFQAPDFYLKLGFREVTRFVLDEVNDIEKIFFIKDL